MPEVTPPASNGHPALKQPSISFEFFPPKTEEMEKSLWETIKRLAPLAPSFVSVTYGAGGSTRERTHSTIARILKETALLPAAHLTCVGAARGEIDDIVGRYHDIGVRHIVALRGDPPDGIGTPYRTHPDGYQTSAELVAGIKRQHGDIEVSVSAYPEKHPESRDFDADLDMLQAKVDAGAIGHRDELRRERRQAVDGLPQALLHLLGLRREELERDRRVLRRAQCGRGGFAHDFRNLRNKPEARRGPQRYRLKIREEPRHK